MIVAGVDVGNATTEVVLIARSGTEIAMSGSEPMVVGAYRVPTRGPKGSPSSLQGAASALQRAQRAAGVEANRVVMAPLRPVTTTTAAVDQPALRTGRLSVAGAGMGTPGGEGYGVGCPYVLGAGVVPEGPVVVLAPAGLGYRRVAHEVAALMAGGVALTAVVVPGDEGVLVANRLPRPVAVIDQVVTDGLATSLMVAVEVRPAGHPLRRLNDPVALAAAFGLDHDEAADAAAVGKLLVDRSNAVVALATDAAPTQVTPTAWVKLAGGCSELVGAFTALATLGVGVARSYCLPGDAPVAVDDLFAVDIGEAADRAGARRGTVASARSYLLASLARHATTVDHASVLSDALGVTVDTAPSEAGAARIGALTTPGGRPDAVVVDLGAGTVDGIGPTSEVVAAGAGELLTWAVAATLDITRSAADWVKRGPCVRVEGGRRFEAEDGARGFFAEAVSSAITGRLAVPGPAGLLPFDRQHTPAEWRALRLRLKEAVIAANVTRVLASSADDVSQVLVVGGPAGDDEVLGVLARALPDRVSAGRAEVGGTLVLAKGVAPLGHRYAAALGLALTLP